MNILKRSMAMFLVLCMLVGMVPMTAFADETDSTDPGVTESIEENEEFEKAAEETTEAIEETTETTEETMETTEETMEKTEETTEAIEETTETTEEITEVTEETTKAAKRAKKVASAEVFVEPEEKISNYSFEATDFMKVFHLDCGRKYFTVDQVKELINVISNVGFSHMELAIGNDGLRLLLDDMSVEANETTYSSDTVKSGIKSGNAAYSHAGEWSETEMNEIISYAKSKGIEIIPLVNNPGHMDSILAAMKACGIDGYYKRSTRTVDLENDEAVSFTQALVMKYANYFSSKGCNYFNIGADEYANDYHTSDSTGMGFGYLIDNNKYGKFIAYVNTLVDDICDLGMTPIAFNDGIYFRENTSFGTFDTRLMIAAWTGGWGGIKPASTTFLQNKGHRILNTNERWYYVLGRKQSSNSTYCYESALSNAKSESITTVTDHKTGVNPVGAMQCVWCDVPSVDYETYKSNVMTLINTLAENNGDYFTGPNVVEPEVPETVTKTDDKTNISVSAPGLTDLKIAEVKDNAQLPDIKGAGEIKVYDVSPMAGEEAYTGEATISIPVPENWTKVRGGVLASEHGEEVLGIEGELESDMFTFTVPHFSNVVTYAVDADEVIELEVGDSHQFKVTGEDLRGTYTPNPEGVANVTVIYEKVDGKTERALGNTVSMNNNGTYEGLIYNGTYYLIMDDEGKISSTNDVDKATAFTVVREGSNYNRTYTISNGSSYLSVSNNKLTSDRDTFNWSYGSSSGFQYSSGSWLYAKTYYLICSTDGKWTVSTSGTGGQLYNYTETTTEPVDESTVTFTAVAAGETYVTIGERTYKIVVNKKTESATLSIGDNITYTDNSKNVPVVENSAIATATISNGVLKITAKAEGTTKVITDNGEYTIKVIPFNPDTVSRVPVFLWITSHPIDANGISSLEISAGDSNVYSAEGAKLTNLIPFTGTDPQNERPDAVHNLWQIRLQHEGAKQTSDGSDDKTAVGEQVEYIRYYGGQWQVKDTSGKWLDVETTDQLTAYYLMKSPLTDEVDSLVKDWGFQFKDGQTYWQYFDESSYAALSAQVIYEDGSMNPNTKANNSDAPLIDTTVFLNFWAKGQDKHTAARDIGYFLPQFNDHYEIYKITTMHGSCSVTAKSDNATAASVDYGNPDPNDEKEVIVWQVGDGTPELIGKDGNDALQWRKHRDAILIRIYLRAKVTEDSLNVIYYDEKFGDELYSYNISVDADVNFTKDILPKPNAFKDNSERIDVTDCSIKNKNDVTQYLQTDLTKVPEAKGKYNSELYAYTGSEISENGKTLYLYYNIDTTVLKPNFVVDFGLPFTFSLNDVTTTPELVDKVTVSARYGNVDYNPTDKTFTYTPTEILRNIDVLSINIQFDEESTVSTTNVGVTPATTVHYEESFINWDANWSDGNAAITVGNQTKEVLGEKINNFGYDPTYDDTTGASNTTHATASTIGAKGTFIFTGDGIQVFANCTEKSGYVAVQVTNSTGKIVNLSMVDTVVDEGRTEATNGQTGDMAGLPIVSLVDFQNMAHDTYTVTITKIMDTEPVSIDGIRVFNTIKDSSIFKADLEDNPDFYEMRDAVLHAVGVKEDTSVDYKTMYEQVYDATEGAAALITDASVTYPNSSTVQDLLDNGPKNEIFLYSGQTLSFKVITKRVMQLGMKAPQGATSVSIKVNSVEKEEIHKINSSVDMFYTLVADKAESETTYTVQIKNTGNNILSITELKICDDPNAAFVPFAVEDIKELLCDDSAEETPVEPEKPEEPVIVYADAVLNVNVVDYAGKKLGTVELSANGVEGEKAVFTAEEILAAAQEQVPEKYALVDETAVADTEVVYGEEQEFNVQIGKVAVLKITFVNLLGRKQGTSTIEVVQTEGGYCRIAASKIMALAPAKRRAIWLTPVYVSYGNTESIIVPVI